MEDIFRQSETKARKPSVFAGYNQPETQLLIGLNQRLSHITREEI